MRQHWDSTADVAMDLMPAASSRARRTGSRRCNLHGRGSRRRCWLHGSGTWGGIIDVGLWEFPVQLTCVKFGLTKILKQRFVVYVSWLDTWCRRRITQLTAAGLYEHLRVARLCFVLYSFVLNANETVEDAKLFVASLPLQACPLPRLQPPSTGRLRTTADLHGLTAPWSSHHASQR